jgi:Site-specific recombinases, DNA invertase Pin homologs
MKAAIYSRKSKFTGKGDCIENQVQLCKEYGGRLNIAEFLIYEDEGFSGGNLDRPEFQRLLKDAQDKRFDVLICYRLDRISRNIGDFSNLINELENLKINFISIREQFDTSTPLGRAMMYIASVFAQLERETIAERIRDNMLELAKTGRWLGGQTPLGFESEEVKYMDSEFKERVMHKLSPIPF